MTAEITPVQFGALSALVHRTCGIHLHQGKLGLVRSRLAGRLRELGIDDPDAYFARLNARGGELEVSRLVDALTTNKTGFFREPRHFELLRRLLPELRRADRPLALWSAGCSSGEEPYSLAMTVLEVPGVAANARILGTDISARVLARARLGIYPQESLEPVPPVLRQRCFTCQQPAPPRTYAVRDEVRRLVRFARLNLVGTWPMRRSFDLVWCRNVMIYFDKATQQTLVQRFWERLVPGGYLFTGHSESLAGLDHGFRYVQPAVYQRVGR